MIDTLQVAAGEFHIGSAPLIVESSGVGSCVVVVLYDSDTKIGGMAHIMLADDAAEEEQEEFEEKPKHRLEEARYADTAIDWMIEELETAGANPKKLTARVVGGAEMFPNLIERRDSIGRATAKMVDKKLEEHNIKVLSRDLGGNHGRSVSFDLETGGVEIRKGI